MDDVRRAVSFGLTLLLGGAVGCGGDDDGDPGVDGGADDRDGGGGGDGGGVAGEVRWSVAHKLTTDYAPAIAADGTIVVQGQGYGGVDAEGDTVYAMSASGELRWSARTEVGAISAPSPTIVGDTVYVASTDIGATNGTVHSFALADGTPGAPETVTGAVISGMAVAADGTRYVPATALVASGGEAWTFVLEQNGKTGSNPAVGPSGTIYVGARGVDNHNLYAVTPAGTEAWKVDLGAAVVSPIALDGDERVYVVSVDGHLQVFEADGQPAWSYEIPSGHSGGGPVLGPDGTVYVGTLSDSPGNFSGEWMFAIREGEGGVGELAWRTAVGHSVSNSAALSAGGTLYVTDACRALTALDATTGAVQWSFDVPETPEGMCSGFSAPALGPDGTVYVTTQGYNDLPGGTFALVGDGTGPAASAWPVESGDPAHLGRVD